MKFFDKMGMLVYRLAFTRDDDLDLLQIMFLGCVAFFFVTFTNVAMNEWAVTTEMWGHLRFVFIILALAGTPKWVAELIIRFVTLGKGADTKEKG